VQRIFTEGKVKQTSGKAK